MKRLLLVFAVLLGCSIHTNANDAVYYVNGSHIVPLRETDITVSKEVLTICIRDDGFARVDVYYEFNNKGKAKTVDMGFEARAPYNSEEDGLKKAGKHPYIYDFIVDMNGTKLPVRNYVIERSDTEEGRPSDFMALNLNEWREMVDTDFDYDEGSLVNKKTNMTVPFSYAYCFKASFTTGRNVVRHTYRYRMSEAVDKCFSIPYWLTPAMRWANRQIDDFTLRIKAEGTAKQFCIRKDEMWKDGKWTVTEGVGKVHVIKNMDHDEAPCDYWEFSLRNGTYEWHGRNFRPTSDMEIASSDEILCHNEMVNGVEEKLGRFYDRRMDKPFPYRWGEDERTRESTDGIPNGRIMCNLPYANRGHVFKDQKLQAYFSSLWWYIPDPSWELGSINLTAEEQHMIQWGKTGKRPEDEE